MADNQQSKPWYKTKIGFFLAIPLLPFLITYWIWKREELSSKQKTVFIAIFWIFLIAIGRLNNTSQLNKEGNVEGINYQISPSVVSETTLTLPILTNTPIPTSIPMPTAIYHSPTPFPPTYAPIPVQQEIKTTSTTSDQSTNGSSGYVCNCGKTCKQMSSCDEAYFQLRCGCSVRDGDHDGVPCEDICPGG